jgi:hypothetical protein
MSIKSLKYPKGKENSYYYIALLKTQPLKADELYKEFLSKTTYRRTTIKKKDYEQENY